MSVLQAYFADYERNQIVKVNVNKSENQSLAITDTLSHPYGIAVDWVNDWIYWSSPDAHIIVLPKRHHFVP